MKYISILLSILFLSSCGLQVGKKKFLKTYEYAKENRDTSTRPGYEGKVCTVVINQAGIDCVVMLETYEEFCFVEKYRWDVSSSGLIEMAITPDAYFLTIIIDGDHYNDFVFNSYLPAWEVDITNWIKEANQQHQNKTLDSLSTNKTK
jgi:hypothetical protein